MSRTPLFRLLMKAIRATRSANGDVGLARARFAAPSPGLVSPSASLRSGVTRRQVLAATSATGLLAACKTDAATGASSSNVVIVGAGIAGLHCAYRLGQVGVTANVYEASTRTGGRIKTDRSTFGDGLHCELGGELIDTGHETMRDLATELGIDLLDYSTDPQDKTLKHLVGYFDGAIVSEAALVTVMSPVLPKVDAARKALKSADGNISYKDDNGAKALDAMSLSAWLDSASVGGLARKLIEVAYTIEYGLEPAQNNALNFLALVGTDAMAFSVFGDSDELFHAKNGNESFTEQLTAKVGSNRIQFGHSLVEIAETAAGGYTLTFDKGAGSSVQVTADHVVLALPFSVLRNVAMTKIAFPAVKLEAIKTIGYGMNTKLMVGFNARAWRTLGSDGGSYSDTSYQATWDTARLQTGTTGIMTNFTGGNRALTVANGTDDATRDEFIAAIDKMYPGVAAQKSGRSVRAPWPTNPLTKGSYSSYTVGQYTTIAGAEGERYKNVHFAGEHTSRSAQGFMDGAALTGAIAAAEIAKDLGLDGKVTSLDATSQKIWARAVAAGADERG